MRRKALIRTAAITAAAAALATGCKTTELQGGAGSSGTPRPAQTTRAGEPTRAAPARTHHRPAHRPRVHRTTPPRTPSPPRRTAPAAPAAVVAPGTSGERVRELQARLAQLGLFGRNPTGYYGTVTQTSVRSFQRGHGLPATGSVDRRTWAALRGATRPPTRDELHPPTTNPLAKPDPRCLTGHVLCISKTSRTLAWMIDGRVAAAMDVRFGSQYTPTREGLFTVDFKSRDHVSTIYHTAMPFAMFFSGGQAVHYSADFAARGYSGASHGCVNVRDRAKIAAVFDQVRAGDKVVVYR
ncbi:L,D-transpeptidase family protein [Streptomyces sp. B1866]|uniref:L,D-transpeptidase family protein n=1 Tax=Streptomyces sp. B1866 TaxID=3075431 RepID=UPI00288D1DED|nr:L,D-transpeptidase family protein [Streptomyces sp. B1866]MDT3397443.1 L,D-transpeptidase family protein [Streptomyces sp. B1866]